MTDAEVVQCSDKARAFITALIEQIGSDVSATVPEKDGNTTGTDIKTYSFVPHL